MIKKAEMLTKQILLRTQVLGSLVGSDAKNALPTRSLDSWLDVAGFSWILQND